MTEVVELLVTVSINHKDPKLQRGEVAGVHGCHHALRFINLEPDTPLRIDEFMNARLHDDKYMARAYFCMTA